MPETPITLYSIDYDAAETIREAARKAMWEQVTKITGFATLEDVFKDRDWAPGDVQQHVERKKNTPEGRAESKVEQLVAMALMSKAFGVDSCSGNVVNARYHGATWQEIADAVGVTRQAAHVRWSKRAEEFAAQSYKFMPEPLVAAE